MSDATQGAPAPGTAAGTAPAGTDKTTTAPAAAPPAKAPEAQEPGFIAERLERERRAVLRQLGVKAPKDVPASQVIQEAKQKIDGRKERLRVERTGREAAEQKVAALESQVGVVKKLAEVEMGLLTDKQRELVKTLAGDDPAKQLESIASIKAIATSQAPAASEPAKGDPPKPIQPPVTTAPPPAPAPTTAGTEASVKERYAQIRSINDPTTREAAKALFLLEHGDELLRNL